MKRTLLIVIAVIDAVCSAGAADLPTMSSQDLLGVYRQLRSIPGSRRYAPDAGYMVRDNPFADGRVLGRPTFHG
jgi:hypothetical protein